jgi:hypothetical protein
MSHRELDRRLANSSTTKGSTSWTAKDVTTLAFSATAIVLTLVGTWFQFFRNTAHLSMAVSHVIIHFEERKPNLDFQSLQDSYDVSFLNTGNRPILITTIRRAIKRLSNADINSLEKMQPRRLALMEQKRPPTPKQVLNLAKRVLDALPSCSEPFIGGHSYWQKYQHNGMDHKQSPVVIGPGEFFVMSGLKMFEEFIKEDTVSDTEKVTYMLCLEVDFIKPNGLEGSKSLPVALATVGSYTTANNLKSLLVLSTSTFSTMRSID